MFREKWQDIVMRKADKGSCVNAQGKSNYFLAAGIGQKQLLPRSSKTLSDSNMYKFYSNAEDIPSYQRQIMK